MFGVDEALAGVRWHFLEERKAGAWWGVNAVRQKAWGRGQAYAGLLRSIPLATLFSCLFSLSLSYPFSGLCTVFVITEVIIWPQSVVYSQFSRLLFKSFQLTCKQKFFSFCSQDNIILEWLIWVPDGRRLGFLAISLNGHYGNLLRWFKRCQSLQSIDYWFINFSSWCSVTSNYLS